jgi:hypothetical protein
MSLVKNIAIGVGSVVVLGLGYLTVKRIRGKKEETIPPKTCYTKEQIELLLQEDERIYNELKALHYSDETLAKLRASIAEKRAELARMS